MKIIDFVLQNGGSGGGITPSGTITLSANGVYDVTNYASASVNVPGPSGSISISANGTYDVSAFASAIVNVSGGGADIMANYAEGTATYFDLGSASFVRSSAFFSYRAINDVNMPNVLQISNSAFMYNSVRTISAPLLVSIYSSAFGDCSALEYIDLPEAVFVGNSAFQSCSKLSYANLPKAEYIGSGITGGYTFAHCSLLQSVSIPAARYLAIDVFMSCTKLPSLILPNVSTISQYALQNCTALESLYLLSTARVTMASKGFLSNTPIVDDSILGYFGSIYVRESLYADYLTANYWSSLSARFVSLTDLQVSALLS